MMTTVFIWNNNNIVSTRSTQLSHFTIGHCSLNITDKWGKCPINLKPYVTWWRNGYIIPTCKLVVEQLKEDIFLELYAPDHVIKINDIKLDTTTMMSTWAAIKIDITARYNKYFNNCSDIASRILLAGMRSNFKFIHKRIIWTPLQVKRLAYDLGGRDISWLHFIDELTYDSDIPEEIIDYLKSKSRRSSRHGYKEAAKPRFVNGIDTQKWW
ncbi:MAG: hypothetical protein PUP46_01575 [Endozoicomonas sp. (ex Botrylloides leachii)]|nr:hypothetical protein [Endozoicomonas sp. (ex Botrylloides leachii)]